MNAPIPLGTMIKEYGKVGAVACIQGERYYFMVRGNLVSMIPAFMLEERKEQDNAVNGSIGHVNP